MSPSIKIIVIKKSKKSILLNKSYNKEYYNK